jgi:antitoxin component of RelBE/YafQ-DinJ toxin-antitoxin module
MLKNLNGRDNRVIQLFIKLYIKKTKMPLELNNNNKKRKPLENLHSKDAYAI